jgi:hypothetical protein
MIDSIVEILLVEDNPNGPRPDLHDNPLNLRRCRGTIGAELV